MKKIVNQFLGISLLSLFISLTLSTASYAVNASDFQPGRIIDDEVFYNKNAMGSAQAVQDFIISHTPSYCDTQGTNPSGYGNLTNTQYARQIQGWSGPPYVCLKNYHENPNTGETSFEKGGGAFVGGLNAGQIIWNASQKYSINPQVLLVTLRKESLNLFGDSWPQKSQYRYAMGYACPDSGPNASASCTASKSGFYKQVDLAAWQLREYYNNMGSYNYAPGRWNKIQYNPQLSCGIKDVYIENYATASLYIYTPYVPNDASLNAYPGTASCGAYGNRNFWFMFNEWFGSTTRNGEKIAMRAHVSGTGWMNELRDNGTIGTIGQNKPIESFMIRGEVEYSSYSQNTGWQPTVSLGMVSGTTGQGRSIQAIKIRPIGSLSTKYDIYYRAHVSDIGWMNWTKNGAPSGVINAQNRNIEAIDIKLVVKGGNGPSGTGVPVIDNGAITYSPPVTVSTTSHVSYHGWQPTVSENMTSGTIKQGIPIEAIRLSLQNNTGTAGNIVYSTHVSGLGWREFSTNNTASGTTGQGRALEAIRITLTGDLNKQYDVWYRSHIQGYGWLGWTKNNLPSGSVGAALRLEAVEIRLRAKDKPLSQSSTTTLYNPNKQKIPDTYSLSYSSHASNLGWLTNVSQSSISGTVKQSRSLEAIKIASISSIYGNLTISCEPNVRTQGWKPASLSPNDCGTTGRNLPLEGFKLTLSGAAADKYTLQYRTHLATVGWQDWVSQGALAGQPGTNRAIEAYTIRLVERQ